MPSLFTELRRRNVFKVGAAYAIVAWLLIEVSSVLLPTFNAPEWIMQVFTLFVILGFPVALLLAWAYEITPEGIKADSDVPRDNITPATGQRLNYAIVGLLVLAVGVMFLDNYVLEEDSEADVRGDDRPSIAVLPLDNLSPDPENAFFADGIHGDLLTQLSKIGSLKVISRTSVMTYRNSPKNMREIGEELGVATILEGDVRRAGDTVRINVQLIDAETDEHLWAETYDRELTAENIFAIQSEMAISIAEALQTVLTPQEMAQLNELPTQNTRAYDFFLSGNEYFRRGDSPTFISLSVLMYERAVEEDPQFALALASLSRAHSRMFWYGIDRTDYRRSTAEATVQRALELAPELPEAHLAMGYYHYWGFRAYELALEEFAIAEQGMPGAAELFEARAYIQRRLGQWEQSIASMDLAIELDPRNSYLVIEQAHTYEWLRDYNQAEKLYVRVLEIAPDDATAYNYKAAIPLHRDGDITPVKAALENPPTDLGDDGRWIAWLAALYERDYDMGLEIIGDFESDVYQGLTYFSPKALMYGATYSLAGQPELAEPAFEAARVQVEQALDVNPDDPRLYVALGVALAGLEEPDAALRAARRATELLPTSNDALFGPSYQLDASWVLIAAGDHNAAIKELDAYLAAPGRWSIEGLLLDPRLDPIRNDPRFQALVEKYGRQ